MTYREYYHRHLPHWQPVGATLFITFRLAGSLPATVISELRRESEMAKKALLKMADLGERYQQDYLEERLAFGRWDKALDHYTESPKWLSHPEIAKLIAEALHFRDKKVYDLKAYCIMPNHVHLICTPLPVRMNDNDVGRIDNPTYSLQTIMQSLKRHTARQANLILGKQGPFWQDENYDHVIRDDEFERAHNLIPPSTTRIKNGRLL